MSAEVIQKQETADEDAEGNPEVEVGGYYAKQMAASSDIGGVWQYFNLRNAVGESGVPS